MLSGGELADHPPLSMCFFGSTPKIRFVKMRSDGEMCKSSSPTLPMCRWGQAFLTEESYRNPSIWIRETSLKATLFGLILTLACKRSLLNGTDEVFSLAVDLCSRLTRSILKSQISSVRVESLPEVALAKSAVGCRKIERFSMDA